jgi:hypothetical protein
MTSNYTFSHLYNIYMLMANVILVARFIAIGLSSGIAPLTRMPGWASKHSWRGYHGDNGGAYCKDSADIFYEKYEKGDVVGCGLDQQGRIFFTKNGKMQGMCSFQGPNLTKGQPDASKNLGAPFHDISGQMFPVVGMRNGGHVRANFGPEFLYQFEDEY